MFARDLIREAIDKNFESLDLSDRGLTAFPSAICKIANLKELNVSYNNIPIVPYEIAKLNKLKNLNLSNNLLRTLPKHFAGLINLEVLNLSNNSLAEIPSVLAALKKIYFLNISGNNIKQLDSLLGVMHKLADIDLSDNSIAELPIEIGRLVDLENLNVSNNDIKEIPKDIVNIKSLKNFQTGGNPLEKPPLEIVVKGLSDMKRYFEQLGGQKVDLIYEAKLLIVGEPDAGKTTLAQILKNPNYTLQDEPTTKGIDVGHWEFKLSNNKPFKVNIWDFGGQEIYHATHQFFLTKRSIYILVADTRKQDTDFVFWLNLVSLLSGQSPLIIFNNEKKDRRKVLDECQLRTKYKNLKEVRSGNFYDKRGVKDLISDIKKYIGKLPHIGSALPPNWVKIRNDLEADSRDYISIHEYYLICSSHGLTRMGDKLQLIGYLHDLGVCLHFRDDPILKKTVILTQEWGTNAVYKILDNDDIANKFGKFTEYDLTSIWNSEKYLGMHDELLQLMIKFKLCYQIPSQNGQYIAPQLLTQNKPNYDWKFKDSLILKYRYDFMPRGLITRFIVTMNSLIYKQNLVWKFGVILKSKSSLAEVIAPYGGREINIRVTGKGRRDFMTIVMHEIDKIHETYHGLVSFKLIPCSCTKCLRSNKPHTYSFDHLKKYLYNEVLEIPCVNSGETVSILRLIDDVLDYESISKEMEGVLPTNVFNYYFAQGGGFDMSKITTKYKAGESITFGDKSGNIINNGSMNTTSLSGSMTSEIELLKTSVENIMNAISEELTPDIHNDLESFISEVSKEKPRKKWYELSGECLIEAAETVGKIGLPVIVSVGKILKLLSGT